MLGLSPAGATFPHAGPSTQPLKRQASLRTPLNTNDLRCPYLLPSTTRIADLPRAIMSASLGRHTCHTLDAKIAAVARSGYHGIEIHFECLQSEARRIFSLAADSPLSHEQLYTAARTVRAKCDAAGLRVICLEPFLHYPGLLPLSRRDERLQEVPLWFTIADLLGTDMIQVASAMFGGDNVSQDETRIVADLRMLAELGLQWPRTKYWAYEAMCFGAYTTTWQQAWTHVQRVDRPNFGMVIDTFQIAAAAYADPSAQDGKRTAADLELACSLDDLRATFGGVQNRANRNKLFFMQLGDAKRMDPPLNEQSELFDATQHANVKMCWARYFRLFPGEGYLPALDVARTVLEECGWRGWISAEYFNRDTFEADVDFPNKAAERCRIGQAAFVEAMREAEP